MTRQPPLTEEYSLSGPARTAARTLWLRHTLRTRALVVILLALVGEVALVYGLARGILLGSFADLEADEARRNTARVTNALTNNLRSLAAITADWAEWDDTYLFAQGLLPSYRDTALDDSTFTRLNVHLIVLIDSAGQIVYAKIMPPGAPAGREMTPTQAGRYFAPHTTPAELSHLPLGQVYQGLTVLPEGPLLLAAAAITPGSGEGPAHGTLVMGRFVGAEEISALASLGTIRLDIRHYSEPNLPPDFLHAYETLTGPSVTAIEPVSNDYYAGYALFDDLMGRPVFVLRVEMPRPITAHGRDTVSYLLVTFFMGGLALAGLSAVIIDRAIVARVLRLTRLVRAVAETQDTSLRAPVDGRDELATLAAGLNGMLHSVETVQQALADTAAAINSSLELDTVLDRVLANIGRVASYDMANILLVDGGVARVVGTSPPLQDAEQIALMNRLRMPLSDFANLREMTESGKPQLIADTSEYAAWVVLPPHDWIRSVASAPIISAGEVIGFVILNSATPGFFTQAHAERLQAFADQVAIALRNARLFAAVQQHAAELEQRVRERTEELEQRRMQLQAILDSIGEGVIYDEKLHTRYVNRALTTLTGYEAGEFTGYLELLRGSAHTRDEFAAIVQEIYDATGTTGTWEGEVRLRRKDGREFDAALIVSQVRNMVGESIGAVTVIRDISQQKALQEQRDRFIANASHELRTPLANLKTRLYLLRHQPEQAPRHLEIIERVVSTMSELIESLLDVSRFERGVIALNRRPVVLQDLITDVTTIQQAEAERKRITLSVSLPPAPLTAYIDPHRMAQVFTNLITNAINYTPEEGQVEIELSSTLSAHGPRAIVRVSDSGGGIAPHLLDQVFEPFFRAHEGVAEGMGLGLAIAREIVRLHGGEIWVESTVGQGSVFSVALEMLSPSESVSEEAES